MADRLDRRIRQLMGEIDDAAPDPHEWDDVRSGRFAESAHSDPRSRLVLVAAAVVVVGALGVGISMVLRGPDQIRTNDGVPSMTVDVDDSVPGARADSDTTTSPPTSTTSPPTSTATASPSTNASVALDSSLTDALRTVAAETGSSVLVAETPDGGVVSWRDGTATLLDLPADDSVTSDGTFVFSTRTDAGAEGITYQTTAVTLDGTRVCDVDGRIHRLRQRDDGGFVASVERDDQIGDLGTADEVPVPNVAVDCQTLEATPIEPISWRGGDSTWRTVTVVNGRSFSALGDAEGNADVVNESGASINGDDYAGSHVYRSDGSQVAYGDYGVSTNGSALTTETVRSRDTTTGDLLWSVQLDHAFAGMFFVGDLFVAELPPAAFAPEPWRATEYLNVYDASTGALLRRVDTDLMIVYLGDGVAS